MSICKLIFKQSHYKNAVEYSEHDRIEFDIKISKFIGYKKRNTNILKIIDEHFLFNEDNFGDIAKRIKQSGITDMQFECLYIYALFNTNLELVCNLFNLRNIKKLIIENLLGCFESLLINNKLNNLLILKVFVHTDLDIVVLINILNSNKQLKELYIISNRDCENIHDIDLIIKLVKSDLQYISIKDISIGGLDIYTRPMLIYLYESFDNAIELDYVDETHKVIIKVIHENMYLLFLLSDVLFYEFLYNIKDFLY